MEREEIKKIIEVRNQIITLYNHLEGKHEPHSVVKQSDVARELESMIKKIDNMLKDKVQFT